MALGDLRCQQKHTWPLSGPEGVRGIKGQEPDALSPHPLPCSPSASSPAPRPTPETLPTSSTNTLPCPPVFQQFTSSPRTCSPIRSDSTEPSCCISSV